MTLCMVLLFGRLDGADPRPSAAAGGWLGAILQTEDPALGRAHEATMVWPLENCVP